MQSRVIRHLLEGTADRFQRVGIPLFTVGRHRLAVERPRVTPVDSLVRLAWCGADGEHGSVTGRLPPRLRPDEHECSRLRVDRLAVDLERHPPVEHDVQLLLARADLVVLIDQRAILAGRDGVDSECVDPEALAHRKITAAPLDVFEVRDAPVRLVVHPIPFLSCASVRVVESPRRGTVRTVARDNAIGRPGVAERVACTCGRERSAVARRQRIAAIGQPRPHAVGRVSQLGRGRVAAEPEHGRLRRRPGAVERPRSASQAGCSTKWTCPGVQPACDHRQL